MRACSSSKGESRPDAPRAKISYPDAAKKDSKAPARGDVPVLMLNSNALKDRAEQPAGAHRRRREPPVAGLAAGRVVRGNVLGRRTAKGWEKPSGARNEAWDLAYYMLGLLRHRKVDRLNWDTPPSWAAAAWCRQSEPAFYAIDHRPEAACSCGAEGGPIYKPRGTG